jgi:hypothetical protein
MKLSRKSLLLAASASGAVLALLAFELVGPSSSHAADPARVEQHEVSARHDGVDLHGPTAACSCGASWGDVFNANWR